MDRMTNKEYYPEIEFCNHCEYHGEPNGCNRDNGACAEYSLFAEAYERLAAYEDTGLMPDGVDALKAENARLRAELEAAKGDLRMVCTSGEPCAACHHCCDKGDQFPCDKYDDWCGSTGWQWRGASENGGEL